jgi:nucleotide-binding universal stress UspA family protein
VLVAVMPNHIDFIGAEGGYYDPKIAEREKENYRAILEQGLKALSDAGHTASGQVLTGDVVAEITGHARKIGADLIVVGHKHLDGWAARWWRGSSSSALIEHAHCSVLVAITS